MVGDIGRGLAWACACNMEQAEGIEPGAFLAEESGWTRMSSWESSSKGTMAEHIWSEEDHQIHSGNLTGEGGIERRAHQEEIEADGRERRWPTVMNLSGGRAPSWGRNLWILWALGGLASTTRRGWQVRQCEASGALWRRWGGSYQRRNGEVVALLFGNGSRDGGEATGWRFLSRWCAREQEIESGGRGREWWRRQGNA
jgi:hypothetical protein